MTDSVAHLHRSHPAAGRALSCAVASLIALAAASCDKSSSTQPKLPVIDSDVWASYAAMDLATLGLKVRTGLSNGTYSNTQVPGTTGTATLAGTVSFQSGLSCGSSCVRSQNNTNLTIVFNQFVASATSNTSTTVTGTITYSDNEWSQQSGLNYSSGGSLCVSNTGGLTYRMVGTDPGSTLGVSDVILSFNSCGSSVSQSGSMTTSSGTFSF